MEEELTVYVGKGEDERKEEEDCCICLDKPATCVLIPCGHKACCSDDACKRIVKSHGKCPLCRTVFEGMADLKLRVPAVQRQNSQPRYPRLSWPSNYLWRQLGTKQHQDQEQGRYQSGSLSSSIRRLSIDQQNVQAGKGREDVTYCAMCVDEQATCTLFPCRHRACCSSRFCKNLLRNRRNCPLCLIQVDAILDSQAQEFEDFQQAQREEEEEEDRQDRPLSIVLWVRILFSVVLFFVTPFGLVSFLDNRFPGANHKEKGTMLLAEGLKYYGVLILIFLVFGSCVFFIAFGLAILVPFSLFSNGENAYAALGFRLAPLMKVCGMIIMVSWWPDYTDNYVNEKGRLKTLLRGVLVSLPDNVFTAWLISLVLVPEEFEQVDNSIRDLCLLAGTMYSPFYCPLLTIVFPDLLVNLTNTT